jgi:hypothetical protein
VTYQAYPFFTMSETTSYAEVLMFFILMDDVTGAEGLKVLVEPIGIEPMTSCLQSRRSPS